MEVYLEQASEHLTFLLRGAARLLCRQREEIFTYKILSYPIAIQFMEIIFHRVPLPVCVLVE